MLSDPLDRALQYREEGYDRKQLKELGFFAGNRGNLGISGFHVHEVTWSCKAGVKHVRYKQVDAVRVPQKALVAWRNMNKERCASDALLPKYSPEMHLACLTKTHFTHGNKLFADGNRTLFNEGRIPIVFNEVTGESAKILTDGVVCSIYREELWDDPAAMDALMQVDNDDSDIQMGEDEMQFLGRVEVAVTSLTTRKQEKTVQSVLEEMNRAGLRTFSEEQARCFIEFRLRISAPVAECFRQCVFHSVCGRVVVTPSDFKLVAALDPRALWLKTAIIMRLYMSTMAEKFPPGHVATGPGFTGRVVSVTAIKLKLSWIKELGLCVSAMGRFEVAITKILCHYLVKSASLDKVMSARTMLFSNIGKLALKLGCALDAAATKAEALKKTLSNEQRNNICQAMVEDQISEVEMKYRDALIQAHALASTPDPIFAKKKETTDGAKPAAALTPVHDLIDVHTGTVKITTDVVMKRLEVGEMPATVRLTSLSFLQAEDLRTNGRTFKIVRSDVPDSIA